MNKTKAQSFWQTYESVSKIIDKSYRPFYSYVMDGSEAGVDLVLIQTFLLYYVSQVILMLTSIIQG